MQSAPNGQIIQFMPGGTTVASGGALGTGPGVQTQQVIYMPSPGTSGQMVMYQQQGK